MSIKIAAELVLLTALNPIYNLLENRNKISKSELTTAVDKVEETLKGYAIELSKSPDYSWVKDYAIGKEHIVNGVLISLNRDLRWLIHDGTYKFGVCVCPEGVKSPEEAYQYHLKVRL